MLYQINSDFFEEPNSIIYEVEAIYDMMSINQTFIVLKRKLLFLLLQRKKETGFLIMSFVDFQPRIK